MFLRAARRTPLVARLRRMFDAGERARAKKLATKSERIVVDIVDKLKKGKSDYR
jgi:hypothetical protein